MLNRMTSLNSSLAGQFSFAYDDLSRRTSLTRPNTYDAFGNVTASTGSNGNPYRYTGRDYDSETGLYYYRARYYDQVIGRFTNQDPYQGNGDKSDYVYVGNNAVNFFDPSGLTPEKPCECNGNSGGIRVAWNCCRNAPPVSNDTGHPPYDPCFTYMWVNANYMYRHGGDAAWGNIVRGCLACSYKYGTDSSAAHAFCYASGYNRADRWYDPLVVPGGSRSNWGLARAVGGAVAGFVNQATQYVRSRGAKPFGCLNVK